MLPQPVLLSIIQIDTRVNAPHSYSSGDSLHPLPGPDYHESFHSVPQLLLKLRHNHLFLQPVQLVIHYHPITVTSRGMSSEGVVVQIT
jgi:hypothetical protein